MLIVQVGLCFVLWMGLVIVVGLNARRLRPFLQNMSRRLRIAAGPVLMILGAGALLGGLGLIAAFHGLTQSGLTPWAWLLVALIGIVFVGLQAMSSLMMVSLASENEPTGSRQASEGRINDRNSHEPETTAQP